MKRLLCIMVAALIFTACAASEPAETTVEIHTIATEDPRAGLPDAVALEKDHTITAQNNGAVTVYALDNWAVGSFAFAMPCNNGVALHEASSGVMWVFDPQTGLLMESYDGVYRLEGMDATGFASAQSDTAVTVYQYGQTQSTHWTLPLELVGVPVADPAGGQVYYCLPGKIMALDMNTGLTRVLREHSYEELLPVAVKGTLLQMLAGETDLYISTVDGRTVYEDGENVLLGINEDVLLTMDQQIGAAQLLLVKPEQTTSFHIPQGALIPMPDLSGLLAVQGDNLCHYDLSTGALTSQITLHLTAPQYSMVDDGVWILDENMLYYWDLTKTAELTQPQSIHKPYYTAQAPDTQGLADCKARAQALSEKYGLKIRLWDDVTSNAPLELEQEYRVDVLNSQLDRLEELLPNFPQDFLRITIQNDWVYVDLVKSIEGGETFLPYWDEGGCHVAITLEAPMDEAFYTGLGWGIDSRILGNSRDLEYWEDLNPQGFTYDYDYELAAERDETEYLEGEEQYFTDRRAMAFPSEDRARIFYHAMTEGNDALFQKPVLQQKLRLVCEGIREAYNLAKHTQTFPWEQYLEESLAYEE